MEKNKYKNYDKGDSAPEGNFVRHMVGTYIDPKTNEWMISHVAFDPATLRLSTIETERVAGNYQVMLERLQIKQANLGLTETGDFPEEVKTKLY